MRELHRRVQVAAGGRIEVSGTVLPEGAVADVTIPAVEQSESDEAGAGSLRHRIGAAQGAFTSPEEADAFVRRERDA